MLTLQFVHIYSVDNFQELATISGTEKKTRLNNISNYRAIT